MKVLSLLQPWASLVALGHKKIETRSWQTKYRGPLLIHASAKKPTKEFLAMHNKWTVDFGINCYDEQDYPLGAIIGKVNLVHIVQSHVCFLGNQFHWNSHRDNIKHEFAITEHELAFGDYSRGRHGWFLSDPILFDTPTPAKGKLSIWDFDESLLTQPL